MHSPLLLSLSCSVVLPLSALTCAPSLVLLFCSLFPCFYRQKTGERETRVAIVLPPLHCPSNMWKASGKWGVLGRRLFGSSGEEKAVRTGEEKIFFFLCFACPREEEDPQCCQNDTVSGPFFLMNSG